MKRVLIVVAFAIVASLPAVNSCRGGFLQRAYQGNYENGGFRYVVNVDGTINVQTMGDVCGYARWECSGCYVSATSTCSARKDWVTQITVKDRASLQSLITGLTVVQKAIEDADKEK